MVYRSLVMRSSPWEESSSNSRIRFLHADALVPEKKSRNREIPQGVLSRSHASTSPLAGTRTVVDADEYP